MLNGTLRSLGCGVTVFRGFHYSELSDDTEVTEGVIKSNIHTEAT